MFHQNRVNLGQLKVNLNQNLDKVLKNKGLMGKRKSMTSETMTKNGKCSNDWKWEKFKQPKFLVVFFVLLFLGDQKNFGRPINGEDQPCHWLDDKKLINDSF